MVCQRSLGGGGGSSLFNYSDSPTSYNKHNYFLTYNICSSCLNIRPCQESGFLHMGVLIDFLYAGLFQLVGPVPQAFAH